MTDKTWFIDVDMTLQTSASDSLIDDLMETIEELHGALTIGPGPALGLSLALDAPDAWEAARDARHYVSTKVESLIGNATISAVRVLNEATRTKENETPTFPPMVAIPDIAELLDVTRQQAGRLTHKPGFPTPALETRLGNLWTTAAVESWNERTERTVGRPKTTANDPSLTEKEPRESLSGVNIVVEVQVAKKSGGRSVSAKTGPVGGKTGGVIVGKRGGVKAFDVFTGKRPSAATEKR